MFNFVQSGSFKLLSSFGMLDLVRVFVFVFIFLFIIWMLIDGIVGFKSWLLGENYSSSSISQVTLYFLKTSGMLNAFQKLHFQYPLQAIIVVLLAIIPGVFLCAYFQKLLSLQVLVLLIIQFVAFSTFIFFLKEWCLPILIPLVFSKLKDVWKTLSASMAVVIMSSVIYFILFLINIFKLSSLVCFYITSMVVLGCCIKLCVLLFNKFGHLLASSIRLGLIQLTEDRKIHAKHLAEEFYVFSYVYYLPPILIFSTWIAPMLLKDFDLRFVMCYNQLSLYVVIFFMSLLSLNITYGCNTFPGLQTVQSMVILGKVGVAVISTAYLSGLTHEGPHKWAPIACRFIPTPLRQGYQSVFFHTTGIGGAGNSHQFASRGILYQMLLANPSENLELYRLDNSFDIDPVKVMKRKLLAYEEVGVLPNDQRLLRLKENIVIEEYNDSRWKGHSQLHNEAAIATFKATKPKNVLNLKI